MADKSKDTGTGGINVDGKVYTPDVGVPDAKGGAQGNYSSGDINVDKTTKDISKPTRETFAKYLSKTTLGIAGSSTHTNVYPVAAGDKTKLEETTLKDSQGNPASPGPQNNEAKFNAGFNQQISSNNPAGIRRGAATGTGPDGNVLLPEASTAATSGGNYVKFVASNVDGSAGLQQPIKGYTGTAVEPNLYDYDSVKVGVADGTLNASPTQVRDIKILPASSDVGTDGGTSKNILGTDSVDGNYTLTAVEARALASTTTAKNKFPIDSTPTLVTFRDADGNPVSVTAAQNNITNAKFFTKLIEEKKQGDQTVQTISVRKLSSYTDALTSAESAAANKFIIKRGKTSADSTAVDGNDLLLTIAPETAGVASLTADAKTYIAAVLKPNLNNIYDPKTESGVIIPEYENNGEPSGIKDLNKTHTFATDAGTSKNILGDRGARRLKLLETATQASKVTVDNFFKVDLPNTKKDGQTTILVTKKLTGAIPDSATDSQNNPFNSSFFTKGKTFDSSYSNAFFDASKINNQNPLAQFSIKRGKVDGSGETGNELLPLATTPAKSSDLHIKFTALNTNVSNYTTVLLKKNLYSINDKIKIGNLQNSDFFGLPRLHKPESGPNDAGTFDNIQKDPSKREITRASLFQHVIDEVTGQNAPGNIGNVYKLNVFSSPKELFSFTTLEGIPVSTTSLQNASENLLQYTHLSSDVKLQSSYSNASENLEIRRGKSIQDLEVPDGNTLLKDAAEAGPAGPYVKKSGEVSPTISKYVGAVLGENRYSPQDRQQFVPSDTPGAEGKTNDPADPSPGGQRFENISDKGAPETSFVGRTTLYAPSQLKFGESPQSMVNRGEPPTGYTFRRLTRIGTILQLRAAGEIISITGAQNDDPRSNVEQLAALLPGAGQVGAGVPLSRELLNVTEIIKNLPDESTGAAGISTITQYEGELIDFNSSFEGVVNTALEKFSGFTSFGLSILAIVLVAVILVVFTGLSALFGSNESLDKTKNIIPGQAKESAIGVRGLGSFQGAAMGGGTNFIADLTNALTSVPPSIGPALFGFSPTHNREYKEAVQRGAAAFFGIGSAPPPILSFPGQVIITARAIIRGVVQLVKAFIDIGAAFASGNIMAAIFNLIGIIEVIRNSRVIKALNTFSQIGDRKPYTILSPLAFATQAAAAGGLLATLGGMFSDGPKEPFDMTTELDIGIKISEIDSVIDSDTSHKFVQAPPAAGEVLTVNKKYIGLSQVKSRLQNSKALAWSTYRAPSLSISSKKLDGYEFDDNSKPNPEVLNVAHSMHSSNAGPRISSPDVKAFEDALDGEYMPFYFQDLRTNEIIGLHAFLTSLSDDYSANYESVSGIGRAEPVRIYKDTQRKIGLSFMLAALDKNDFDHMWDKVNRLTMLVYPQYTAGKLYNGSLGIKFEKPFTQQVGASPMVRLRLGNLLRSNYSKFNLARIFGIGSDGTVVHVSDSAASDALTAAKTAVSNKIIGEAINAVREKELLIYSKQFVPDLYKFSVIEAGSYYTKLIKSDADKVGFNDKDPLAMPKLPTLPKPPAKPAVQNNFIAEGEWFKFSNEDKEKLYFKVTETYYAGGASPAPGTWPLFAKGKFFDEKDKLYGPTSKEFFLPVKNIELKGDVLKTYFDAATKLAEASAEVAKARGLAEAEGNSITSTAVTDQNTFMNAENNVIVKSFESTGGKGLAGFIDSINFDWYDRTTWDIDIDRKAPKMCKVTISFTPIHDISPGLDAHGNNRAPIYPLGPYAYGTRR